MIQVSEPSITQLEIAAVNLALARNQLSMGKEVFAFEEEFCAKLKLERGLACSSGTTALHLALAAFEIGPGDEVIVPNLTYVATANAVRYCGATVRLAEIREDDWTINMDSAEELLTPRTKAIIPVDLYGYLPSDLRKLEKWSKENGIIVIEDAAQGIGAKRTLLDGGQWQAGFGDATTFSFFGNKIMTAGEGGFVAFKSPGRYAIAKKLRGQGQDPKRRYWHDVVGFNYRITELQAAILRIQLERLDELLKCRRKIFQAYDRHLAAIRFHAIRWQTGLPLEDVSPWLKTILIDNATPDVVARIRARMYEAGVDTRRVFYPLNRMGVYSERGAFPVSDKVSDLGISLPTHPNMTIDNVVTVCEALLQAMEKEGLW